MIKGILNKKSKKRTLITLAENTKYNKQLEVLNNINR